MRPPLALVLATAIAACQPTGTAPPATPASATAGATAGATASSTGPTGRAAVAWRRIADIPTPRSEVAAAVSQRGFVFLIGGFGGPERVERYDPAMDRWDRGPDLPIGVDHAMAAAVEGLQNDAPQGVFVFGGYASGAATARAFRLDLDVGRWEEIAAMPGPRAAAAAVAIGSRIFVFGGADGSRLVAPTYEYDVIAKRWRTLAAIPTPRDHLAGVVLDATACALGGRRLSLTTNLASFECYDPRSDSWTRMPDAPTPRGGVGAAVYDRRAYFVGGEQPAGTHREVEIFDARTSAWTRGPDLPTPRHGVGVVVAQPTKAVDRQGALVTTPARLLVLSGGPTPGGSQTATCEMLELP